jgi:exoribonuclease-2
MVMHGVVIGDHFMERRWFNVILFSSGETWARTQRDVVFTIPAVVSSDIASQCGRLESLRTRKEDMACVEVLRHIRVVEKAVEHAYKLVGQSIHTIYPQVKSPDPTKWSKITVAEAARLLGPAVEPSLMTTFAVHKHLMSLNREFVSDPFLYRTSQQFDVRPESQLEVLRKVTDMSRMKDGPLESFAQKVRQITASNQKRALETWADPPSQQQLTGSVFSSDDAVIIDFLRHSLRARDRSQPDPYLLGLSAIIRKLDAYTGTVDSSVVYRVLVDIGIFPPWQDLVSYSVDFDLHRYPEETPAQGTRQKLQNPPSKLGKSTDPMRRQDLYPQDPAASIRHDFGDMPVYIIDDVTAQELDDGISFEAIPSEPDSGWVHVHIADPTAVFGPTHEIALHARHQLQSMYFLQGTYAMLPHSLVSNRLTLGSSLSTGGAQEVLTFSLKVDSKGDIVDYNVRLGLIRNIHILDYDGIDLALGVESPEICFPFGGQPSHSSAPKLDQRQVHDLQALHRIANRLVSARLRFPSFIQAPTNLSISLSPKPPAPYLDDLTNTTLFRGFPDVIYRCLSPKWSDYGARRLVSEFMKAASRVASRFCSDHGLPVLRRTSTRILTKTDSDFEKLLSMRDSDGHVDYLEALRSEAVTPSAEYMLEPKMHWALGIPEGEGYVRVTSPLRRYSDLMAHWQIKHALLGSKGDPPFSAAFLQEFAKDLAVREQFRRRWMQDHEKFWALLFIQRWMQNPLQTQRPLDPLEDLVGFCISEVSTHPKTRVRGCRIRLPKLGFNATLTDLNAHADISLGTEVPVRIASIYLENKPSVKVVRKL